MDHDELVRLYGEWAARTPRDVAELFAGFQGTWWVAGGWAIEAFTGVTRDHEDVDPCILRDELPTLRAHLAGRLDVWAAFSGALKPLVPTERPAAAADDVLPEGCEQVWVRRGAAHPWEYDILLNPGTPGEWVFTRDATIRMPMADALWERDGIRYLRTELQLLCKARGQRPKDQADLDAALPLLGDERRAWLRNALERVHPGHLWIGQLA